MPTAQQLAAETRAWKELRRYAAAETPAKKEQAWQAFRSHRQYTSPAAKDELDQALAEIDAAAAEEALAAFVAAAARTRALKDGFDLGAEVAEAESKDLFFPAAASYLGQAADILEKLKKVSDTVLGEIDSLEGGFEKSDINGLIESAKDVVAFAEKIKDVFVEFKDTLPGDDEEED